MHMEIFILCCELCTYFMAFLTAIEASCCQEGLAPSSKPGNRGNKELKSLSCSINYDFKGGSASRGRLDGGVSLVLDEA
jgi:hypothetical protein